MWLHTGLNESTRLYHWLLKVISTAVEDNQLASLCLREPTQDVVWYVASTHIH